ncbi:Dynein heavy chain 5, axonemal [Amphibalanus amphitrite]|uniref:Dynein heavy chain 5, axonemal n=1 Tax=Amphibalanus amphitrite TaxID=1232801 RepID=A0A6A4WR04_AMPAM|nr:Dynein heavy chain 5, axonemal [Amphibalanus amphitrite]
MSAKGLLAGAAAAAAGSVAASAAGSVASSATGSEDAAAAAEASAVRPAAPPPAGPAALGNPVALTSFSKLVSARRKLKQEAPSLPLRRQELDGRSEYLLRCLSTCTGLGWHELLDIVYEEKMLARLEMLFMVNGPQRLLWFCQPPHAPPGPPPPDQRSGSRAVRGAAHSSRQNTLLLTDGVSVPLRGIATAMTRNSNQRAITDDNAHKEVLFCTLPGRGDSLLQAAERLLRLVFIPVISRHPTELDGTPAGRACRHQLLLALCTTASIFHVTESSIRQQVVFEDIPLDLSFSTPAEAMALYKDKYKLIVMEQYVNIWIRQIEEVLMQSELLRKEGNETGPHKELEYWKVRSSVIDSIIEQLKLHKVKTAVFCLQMNHYPIIKLWRRTDRRITDAFNEARDNIRFIYCIEKHLHPLTLGSPPEMVGSIAGLFNAVRMIHSVSHYYNSSERMSALLIKVTNQMIVSCMDYISDRGRYTIWNQPEEDVRSKIRDCISLRDHYHAGLERAETTLENVGDRPFEFSKVYIFGKFDAFCSRLTMITNLFDSIQVYSRLFNSRIEVVEEIITMFRQMVDDITQKKYDYLDYKSTQFATDYAEFRRGSASLLAQIRGTLEQGFHDVWETPQAFYFLGRFEKVAAVVPGLNMADKHQRIAEYYSRLVATIQRHYVLHKDSPPVAWNEPPLAGQLRWARMLYRRLSEPMEVIRHHPALLALTETKRAVRRYNKLAVCLWRLQHLLHQAWMDRNVLYIERHLAWPVVVQEGDELRLNYSHEIRVLLREIEVILRMGLPVPIVASALLSRRQYLVDSANSVQDLLEYFSAVRGRVVPSLQPLLVPHVQHVRTMLDTRLARLTWTSAKLGPTVAEIREAVRQLEVLIVRLVDIHGSRIEDTLGRMYSVRLYTLPGDKPWTLDDFLVRTYKLCVHSAQELDSLSGTIEQGVQELVELVHQHDPTRAEESSSGFVETDGESDGTGSSASSLAQPPSGPSTPIPPAGSELGTSRSTARAVTPQELERRRKEMRQRMERAGKELRRLYHRKVLEVLLRATKVALEALRKRLSWVEKGTLSLLTPEQPAVFSVEASLDVPHVVVSPTLDQVQETLVRAGKIILSVSKGVGQWCRHKKHKVPSNAELPPPLPVGPEPPKSRWGTQLQKAVQYREIQAKHKNYYSYVHDNKEVVKLVALLANCLHNTRLRFADLLAGWEPYHHLWRMDRRATMKAVTRRRPSLIEFETEMQRYKDIEAELAEKPATSRVGALVICTGQLAQPISDLEDVRAAMEVLRRVRDMEIDTDRAIEPIEESLLVLAKFGQPSSREDADAVDTLRYTWQRVQSHAAEVQSLLRSVEPHFRGELVRNLAQFERDVRQFCADYRRQGPMSPGLEPREASDRMQLFQNRFDGLWRRHQIYTSGEELIGLEHKEYPILGQIKKELNLLQKLYRLYNEVIDRVSSYYEILWEEVNIEDINNELMEFQNRCRKLPKGLKEWPAFNALKKTIDDFNDMCPLIELMANKAMKPRHWQRLSEVSKYQYNVESDGFCLKDILMAPLLQYKEDIEDICISAVKERDIEAKLRQVTTEWSAQELSFMTFKSRGELLLRGDNTAEIIGQLEDSLMVLGSLLSNRYNAPFRKQIQNWLADLSNTNEVLEWWLFVQNLWVYLEAVFVGGDIAKQLPKEAKRFYIIDRSWQRIMHRAHEVPNVVSCCVGEESLKQQLPHLQEQLELCQKSLSGYLEKKRVLFPRFFFVSDPALLEILGQASDSHTIQSHLMSIFDNTKSVKFHDSDYDKILAVISSEGETIHLEKPVRADGSVEVWLMSLLKMAQQSLHAIIRQAHFVLQDATINVLNFLDSFPAQVGILGIQMIWTRDAEMALGQARFDRKIMSDTNNRFLELLNLLIDRTAADLTRMERTKYETLVTVHVHQRDIFDHMCRLQVKAVTDFEWLKQCRFYFKDDLDQTRISITDVHFVYQNEFLGCTERLVITPLTDRCYITLAQALHMSMGGCPNGPAGTGKTETVKDMGKTLGKYVVVFNCSDQMDFRGLGRIYKGEWASNATPGVCCYCHGLRAVLFFL